MSVLIKDLEISELPDGDVIRAEIRLIDGEVRLGIMTGGYACSQVWTFYPLVRIPPHGDLIDRDVLLADRHLDTFNALFAVASAYAVIEAEEVSE